MLDISDINENVTLYLPTHYNIVSLSLLILVAKIKPTFLTK